MESLLLEPPVVHIILAYIIKVPDPNAALQVDDMINTIAPGPQAKVRSVENMLLASLPG